MDKIAVAILNYNGQDYLSKFLPQVINLSPEATVYVIDNASTDDSINILTRNFPQTQLIKLDKNYGFSGGYNQGLKQIEAKYFVLLNSDVEVTPNWLAPLYKEMEADTQLAACQPKILSYNNRSHFDYAGAAGGYIDFLGYPFCRGRILDHIEKDNGQYDTPAEVLWASGAALMVRAKLYGESDGLDEDFFAHMEEIDLCWRFWRKGFKIKCFPDSAVYHVGGGTLNRQSPFKTYLNFRNSLYLLVKNSPYFVSGVIIRLLLDGLAGIKFVFDGHPRHTMAILKAHLSFYQNFSKIYKKRGKIAGSLSNFAPGVYMKSLIVSYYLRKQKTFDKLNSK